MSRAECRLLKEGPKNDAIRDFFLGKDRGIIDSFGEVKQSILRMMLGKQGNIPECQLADPERRTDYINPHPGLNACTCVFRCCTTHEGVV